MLAALPASSASAEDVPLRTLGRRGRRRGRPRGGDPGQRAARLLCDGPVVLAAIVGVDEHFWREAFERPRAGEQLRALRAVRGALGLECGARGPALLGLVVARAWRFAALGDPLGDGELLARAILAGPRRGPANWPSCSSPSSRRRGCSSPSRWGGTDMDRRRAWELMQDARFLPAGGGDGILSRDEAARCLCAPHGAAAAGAPRLWEVWRPLGELHVCGALKCDARPLARRARCPPSLLPNLPRRRAVEAFWRRGAGHGPFAAECEARGAAGAPAPRGRATAVARAYDVRQLLRAVRVSQHSALLARPRAGRGRERPVLAGGQRAGPPGCVRGGGGSFPRRTCW